ncbi:MAG TPA: hypothetical protein VHW90_15160 [Stellaceae bacterium]|nr:hypothetical protein [Stellaceae bacterium]
MKFVLGALAAVTLLAGVASAQPADARCFRDGYGWHCWHPHPWHHWDHWGWHHHDWR